MKQVIIGSMVGTTYLELLSYWKLPYDLYHQLGKLRRGLSMEKDPTQYFYKLTMISMIEERLIYLGYPLTYSENLIYYLYTDEGE